MNFKTKILTSVLAVGLTVALVGGSTMAWFTDSKTVAPATFKAGTVRVDVKDSNAVTYSGFDEDNINPGDKFTGKMDIINTGTKPVILRIKIPTSSWTPANGIDGKLNNKNIKVDLPTNWEKHDDGYIYYVNAKTRKPIVIKGSEDDGTIPGADSEDDRTVHFTFKGEFDGDLTTNRYQGATLTVSGGTVEVIQATHDAASDSDFAWAKGKPVPAAQTATPTATVQ